MRLLPRLLDDGLSNNSNDILSVCVSLNFCFSFVCFATISWVFLFLLIFFLFCLIFLTFPPCFVPRSAIGRLSPPSATSIRLRPPQSVLGYFGQPSVASVRFRLPRSEREREREREREKERNRETHRYSKGQREESTSSFFYQSLIQQKKVGFT